MQDHVKRQTRFTSRRPAKDIIARINATAMSMGFSVKARNYKVVCNAEKVVQKVYLQMM